MHAEHNHSAYEPVVFLQLWILPEIQNLAPRYAQYRFDPKAWENHFYFLVGPRQQPSKLWIHQQAFVARASIAIGQEIPYTLKHPGNGVFLFVIEGKVNVAGEVLGKRDGAGLEGVHQLACQGIEISDILAIEVPM